MKGLVGALFLLLLAECSGFSFHPRKILRHHGALRRNRIWQLYGEPNIQPVEANNGTSSVTPLAPSHQFKNIDKPPTFIDTLSSTINRVDSSAIISGFYGGLGAGLGVALLVGGIQLPSFVPPNENVAIARTAAVKSPAITTEMANPGYSLQTLPVAKPLKDAAAPKPTASETEVGVSKITTSDVKADSASSSVSSQTSSIKQTEGPSMVSEKSKDIVTVEGTTPVTPLQPQAETMAPMPENDSTVLTMEKENMPPRDAMVEQVKAAREITPPSPEPKLSAVENYDDIESQITLRSFLVPLLIGTAGFVGAYLAAKLSTESSQQPVAVPDAPPGIATIERWRQNKDGTLSGFVSGATNLPNGEPVITSPVFGKAFGGALVTTRSGSRYYLQSVRAPQEGKNWLGAPVTSASLQSTASSVVLQKAPEGVPTMKRWKENPNGSISGYVIDSKQYSDGDYVTTSPIMSEAISGTVIETGSGSHYFLAPPETALDRKKAARLAKLTDKIPQNAPRGVPIILDWKVVSSDRISGHVMRSKKYGDGDPITTSQLVSQPAEGTLVKTMTGSKYFLGERSKFGISGLRLTGFNTVSLPSLNLNLDDAVMRMPGESEAEKIGVFMFLCLFVSSILASIAVTTVGQIDLGGLLFGGSRFDPDAEIIIPSELSKEELDDFFGL